MTVVGKRKILIASMLKPVNDTRMTEKIAASLSMDKTFEINVVGFPAGTITDFPVHYYPLPKFDRISFARLLAPWKILKIARSIRPDLFIITTHELLLIAVIAKWLTRCKIIYDVQENYYLNILNTTAFPRLLRPIIACYIRLKEQIISGMIDHFFLAEKAYEGELGFLSTRYTVLENKLKRPPFSTGLQKDKYRLLFTGTLAESTGVFTAIALAKELHRIEKKITLTIAGYAAQKSVLIKIREAISRYPFIELRGGDTLVPHHEILLLIQSSGAGIVSYPFNPSTYNAIPTKLYEYLGCALPIILINHPKWVELCKPYNAACVFDPKDIKPNEIIHNLSTVKFYSTSPQNTYWEFEEKRLLSVIHKLV